MGLDVCSDQLRSKLSGEDTIITNHVAAQGQDSFRDMCIKPIEKFLNVIRYEKGGEKIESKGIEI